MSNQLSKICLIDLANICLINFVETKNLKKKSQSDISKTESLCTLKNEFCQRLLCNKIKKKSSF